MNPEDAAVRDIVGAVCDTLRRSQDNMKAKSNSQVKPSQPTATAAAGTRSNSSGSGRAGSSAIVFSFLQKEMIRNGLKRWDKYDNLVVELDSLAPFKR